MRVLVAAKESDLRLAIELYLDEEPGVTIVGTASEAPSLRALVRTTRPDLVLLDWELPGHAPTSLLAEIRKNECPPQIIVLGKEVELKPTILAADADAFVLKGDPPRQLSDAIRQARLRRASAEQSSIETKGE
jgi:DNA-binding NarL/FixJ family response regulator